MERSSNSSELKSTIFLRIDLPIDRSDASRRGIDPALCSFIARFKDKDFRAVGCLLATLCPTDRSIYMTSVGEFVSLEEIIPRITGRSDAVAVDGQLVRLRGAEAITTLLSLWKAETLVLFFANDETMRVFMAAVERSRPKWWKPSKAGCEVPFLAQISLTGSVLFFSEDHMSLEALGDQPSILKFFDRVRAQEL